jgi:hypothetical protein
MLDNSSAHLHPVSVLPLRDPHSARHNLYRRTAHGAFGKYPLSESQFLVPTRRATPPHTFNFLFSLHHYIIAALCNLHRSMVLSHLSRLFAASLPSLSLSIPSRLLRSSLMSVGAIARYKATLRGVVFDMDGTLTVPVIDFQAMYREVLGPEAYSAAKQTGGAIDILHQIEAWGPEEQRRAYEVIARFEQEGLDRLQIMPGMSLLMLFLISWLWFYSSDC